eukprot:4912368-Pleurochrysis_carterae.AAC.1
MQVHVPLPRLCAPQVLPPPAIYTHAFSFVRAVEGRRGGSGDAAALGQPCFDTGVHALVFRVDASAGAAAGARTETRAHVRTHARTH